MGLKKANFYYSLNGCGFSTASLFLKGRIEILKRFLVLLLLSTVSFADDWSESVNVTEIIAGYKEGFILFRTSGDYINPKNCQAMYSIDPERADVDLAMSILLAAQRSGSLIQIGIDTTECGRSGVLHLTNKIKVTRVRSL